MTLGKHSVAKGWRLPKCNGSLFSLTWIASVCFICENSTNSNMSKICFLCLPLNYKQTKYVFSCTKGRRNVAEIHALGNIYIVNVLCKLLLLRDFTRKLNTNFLSKICLIKFKIRCKKWIYDILLYRNILFYHDSLTYAECFQFKCFLVTRWIILCTCSLAVQVGSQIQGYQYCNTTVKSQTIPGTLSMTTDLL